MRITRYLVICLVLFVIGVGSLAEGVHGEASVNAGTSFAANSIHFCGTSSGGWAALGMLASLGAIVFFALALFASMRSRAV